MKRKNVVLTAEEELTWHVVLQTLDDGFLADKKKREKEQKEKALDDRCGGVQEKNLLEKT